MSITKIILAIVTAFGLISCGGGGDSGKTCNVGKPCGDTCIAANETCRQ